MIHDNFLAAVATREKSVNMTAQNVVSYAIRFRFGLPGHSVITMPSA